MDKWIVDEEKTLINASHLRRIWVGSSQWEQNYDYLDEWLIRAQTIHEHEDNIIIAQSNEEEDANRILKELLLFLCDEHCGLFFDVSKVD